MLFLVTKADIDDHSNHLAEDIAELHGDNFTRGWSAEEIQNILSSRHNFAVIAREVGKADGRPIGFNILRTTLDEAEILAIAVDQKMRKLGIGWQLMRASIEHLMSQNIRKLFLEVDENNPSAIALYKNFGFKTVGKRGGYYAKENREASNALIMRLDLD